MYTILFLLTNPKCLSVTLISHLWFTRYGANIWPHDLGTFNTVVSPTTPYTYQKKERNKTILPHNLSFVTTPACDVKYFMFDFMPPSIYREQPSYKRQRGGLKQQRGFKQKHLRGKLTFFYTSLHTFVLNKNLKDLIVRHNHIQYIPYI